MRMINPADLRVPTLGHCTVESPIQRHWAHADEMEIFVSDEDKILLDDSLTSVVASIARNESALAALELAGPRRKLFFDPADSSCAIVTCGGLCPGINDVIRGERRIQQRGYALIVVAEGAGQELFDDSDKDTDLSGNVTLKDIGLLLKKHIENHSKHRSLDLKFKYIDPSYMIRGLRANPQDASYCVCLAQNAVHAAMAGKTGIAITRWHGHYVHVPIRLAIAARKQVDPKGDLWHSVIESTGQSPKFFSRS